MLTVLTWYQARRERRTLSDLVGSRLSERPTLLCIVSEQFRQESHLRPFTPLAEALGDRMDVVLCAEWPQDVREVEGSDLLRRLGLVQWAWPRMLVDNRGELRGAVVLRERRPVGLIDIFFAEKDRLDGNDALERDLASRESTIVSELSRLLGAFVAEPVRRGPPQQAVPPPPGVSDGLAALATHIVQVNEGGQRVGGWDPPLQDAPLMPMPPSRPGVTVQQTVTMRPRVPTRENPRPGVQITEVVTTRVDRGVPPPRQAQREPDIAPQRPVAKPAPVAAKKEDEAPRKDRFELIELD